MKRDKMVIYDYSNNMVEIELPDKEIAGIGVIVLSGDETGYVEFADGSRFSFDASDERFTHFFDGSYHVKKEDVKRWLDWSMDGEFVCASYERMTEFLE